MKTQNSIVNWMSYCFASLPLLVSGCAEMPSAEQTQIDTQAYELHVRSAELLKPVDALSRLTKTSDRMSALASTSAVTVTKDVKRSRTASSERVRDAERAVQFDRPDGERVEEERGDLEQPERERSRTTSRRGFSCDTETVQGEHEHLHALTAEDSHGNETPTHNVLIIPVTYLNPAQVATRDGSIPVGTPYYPIPLSRGALEAELFGLENPQGAGHVRHYLEQASEGQVNVEGTVAEWSYLNQLPPLEDDKCGQELFQWTVFDADHPEYDPESPSSGRYTSPVLEVALEAQGITDIEDFDSLGLVTTCHADTMRGLALRGPNYEVFGKRIKISISSHPHDSDILDYWAFDGAIELGNVSRNMIHEILHVWGLDHDESSDCGEETFGDDCEFIRYGSPFSVLGNPTGIFSLNMMQRLKLGVVDETDFVHITQSGTYTIGGLNDLSSDARGAFIHWYGSDTRRLALNFRTGLGYDSAIGDNWLGGIANGMTVHVQSGSATNTTNMSNSDRWYLVDPVPNNNAEHDLFDRHSVITDSFYDPHAGITIEVLSVSDDEIEFSVDFDDEPVGQVPTRR